MHAYAVGEVPRLLTIVATCNRVNRSATAVDLDNSSTLLGVDNKNTETSTTSRIAQLMNMRRGSFAYDHAYASANLL